MWLKFVMKFLPQEYKDYVDVTLRIFQRLDTADERKAVIASLIRMQKSDGYISAPEWTKWGSELGVIGKRKGIHARGKASDVIIAHTN